jgi:hypothetical protein
MQLSQSNYLQYRDRIDWPRMPAALADKPKAVTDNAAAKGWAEMGEQTKKAVAQFFKLCNLLIAKDGTLLQAGQDEVSADPPQPTKRQRRPAAITPLVKPKRTAAKRSKPGKEAHEILTKLPAGIPRAKEVPVIATHTSFIKRYLAMHDKIKTRDQVVSLLHGLQKAFTEQRIKKNNPALREIQKMQSELIALCGKMDDRVRIEITEPYLSHYREIADGEEVRTSVKLLKQFIQINGKAPDKAKTERLGKKMAAAFDTIPREDIYRPELSAGAKAIAAYVNGTTKTVGIPASSLHGLSGLAGTGSASALGRTDGSNPVIDLLREARIKDLTEASLERAFSKTAAPGLCLELAKLMIRQGKLNMAVLRGQEVKPFLPRRTELAGMHLEDEHSAQGISQTELLDLRLAGAGHPMTAGLGSVVESRTPGFTRAIPKPPAMHQDQGMEKVSARDLAKLRFKTIGYHGRFKHVVGDPAIGFHMMVYGKPFQGKSSFVIELCKDLAALGKGRIAYLALEEGISASMQKKVVDRGAANVDGLDFLGAMPASFAGYSFVVIDSVSDRSMKREALRELFLHNPQTCFICIFHATKEGSARGGLDYSHDMDIILKIENHKPVVEKNRFL